MMKKFFDTSALLDLSNTLFDLAEKFVIAQTTLKELESIKESAHKDEEIKYRARHVLHFLYNNQEQYEVADGKQIEKLLAKRGLALNNDSTIMETAAQYHKTSPICFVTSDLACYFLAVNTFKLDAQFAQPNAKAAEQKGYIRIQLSDNELADFYAARGRGDVEKNIFSAHINQYVVLLDSTGVIADIFRWTGDAFRALTYKGVNGGPVGKVDPRNLEQKLAFDLLQNDNVTIKILSGPFGTGKDYLMLAHAVQMLRTGQINKLVWVRNGVRVKNTPDIGALPGSQNEKLLPYAMPMVDFLGSIDLLNQYMENEKIELENLGAIRGRSWTNSIIYCSEAENLTKEHVQLLIGRVGEGSQLWLNGDYRQVDGKAFEANNGLMIAIDKLSGSSLFGHVKLQKTERSKTAALADCLD